MAPFLRATEDAKWIAAELFVAVDAQEPSFWFNWRDDLDEIQYAARNVANCAFSMQSLMQNNQDIYNTHGVPGCAMRLKTLLNYCLLVIEWFLERRYMKLKEQEEKKNYHSEVFKKGPVFELHALCWQWKESLRNCLVTMDQWIDPQTPTLPPEKVANDDDDEKDEKGPVEIMVGRQITAEPMHEMLGSFYIWTQKQKDMKVLEDPTKVREILRGMMLPKAPPGDANFQAKFDENNGEDASQYKLGNQKWGLPECIFSTRLSNNAEQLVIGSTQMNFSDVKFKKVNPNPVDPFPERNVALDNKPDPNDTTKAPNNIKEFFASKRIERIDVARQEELLKRFRPTDKLYLEPLTDIPLNVLPRLADGKTSDVAGLSREIVNFYIQQQSRPVIPGKRNFLEEDPNLPNDQKTSNKFFQPVPRCMKCRTIMSYIIPKLEAPNRMDKYLTVNPPFACAEDIVHAKLRVLNPDKAGVDAISALELGKETTMATVDGDIIFNDKTPGDKKAAVIQRTAKIAVNLKTSAEAADRQIAGLKKDIETLLSTVDKKVPEDKPEMNDKARESLQKARQKVADEKAKREAGAKEKEEEKARVANSVPTLRQTADDASKRVHEYLKSIKEPELTGEDKERAGKD